MTFSEILNGLAGIWHGKKARVRFEEELKAFYRVRHVFLLSSGKAALAAILMALKELAPGRDEVLIPGYTCFSVPAAIVRAGLRVRTCDIDPLTLDFDRQLFEKAIDNERLLCVIPTHLFGLAADVPWVRTLAEQRGITVVEDAAQAMGGEVEGRKTGTLGNAGFFSLGRGKALSTVSGGIIITESDTLAAALTKVVGTVPEERALDAAKTFCYSIALWLLIRPHLYWLPKALPFLKLGETVFDPAFEIKKLGSFQAGVAKGWQTKLARLKRGRQKRIAALVDAGIEVPQALLSSTPNIIKLPVLVRDPEARQRVLERSEQLGLGIATVYPNAIAAIPELTGLTGSACPQAEEVARTILSLPVHQLVTDRDINRVTNLLGDCS